VSGPKAQFDKINVKLHLTTAPLSPHVYVDGRVKVTVHPTRRSLLDSRFAVIIIIIMKG
jgi:hypothetical protein